MMIEINCSLKRSFRVIVTTAFALFIVTPQAWATWSMVIVDTHTGEVAIGQATCVANVNLLDRTPVMMTRTGGATVAAYTTNINHARGIIRDGFAAGATPEEILEALALEHPQHESHQYCIVGVDGNTATYTGTVAAANLVWNGGQAGRWGNISYSVAGNVLTGAPVVEQAVQAIIETEGDVSVKLMAAMMAARDMGGDGRCSCAPNDPTGCGSPPDDFEISAINGYMVLARAGDVAECLYCSDADLFMRINVAMHGWSDPDPVLLMADQFDAWRAGLVGRPDAVRSGAAFDPPELPADGASTTELTIMLRDWDDGEVTVPISLVTVEHAPDSEGFSAIGDVVDNGDGTYSVMVTAGDQAGRDRFLVTIDDGLRPVILMPEPALYLTGDPLIVTGPGEGPDNVSDVHGYSIDPIETLMTINAYGVDRYGVNVAVGDLDGDRAHEVITGAGPGRVFGPHVRGFDGDGTPLPGVSFLAYGTNRFGVNVASGDLDGDGYDEIVTGAGPGAVFGPHVRGWNVDETRIVRPVQGVSFFAYGTPRWGVNVAAGDVDGDGYDEIFTGAGPGSVYGPHVRGWNVDGGGASAMPGVSFLAYATRKYGVNVACGDIDGDGYDEILTGAGPGAVFAPHVRAWNVDGGSAVSIAAISFFAFNGLRYGACVGSGDIDSDGIDELLVGAGPDESAPALVQIYNYDGGELTMTHDFEGYQDISDVTHGVNVTAGRF